MAVMASDGRRGRRSNAGAGRMLEDSPACRGDARSCMDAACLRAQLEDARTLEICSAILLDAVRVHRQLSDSIPSNVTLEDLYKQLKELMQTDTKPNHHRETVHNQNDIKLEKDSLLAETSPSQLQGVSSELKSSTEPQRNPLQLDKDSYETEGYPFIKPENDSQKPDIDSLNEDFSHKLKEDTLILESSISHEQDRDSFKPERDSHKIYEDSFIQEFNSLKPDLLEPESNSHKQDRDSFKPGKDSHKSDRDSFKPGKDSHKIDRDSFKPGKDSHKSDKDSFELENVTSEPNSDSLKEHDSSKTVRVVKSLQGILNSIFGVELRTVLLSILNTTESPRIVKEIASQTKLSDSKVNVSASINVVKEINTNEHIHIVTERNLDLKTTQSPTPDLEDSNDYSKVKNSTEKYNQIVNIQIQKEKTVVEQESTVRSEVAALPSATVKPCGHFVTRQPSCHPLQTYHCPQHGYYNYYWCLYA